MKLKFSLKTLTISAIILVISSSVGFAGITLANSKIKYTDIDLNNSKYESVKYITKEGIVNGFPDGTFKPDNNLSRAEFTKIIVNSFYPDFNEDDQKLDCFPDVDNLEWYAPYVCFAKVNKIISGFDDGTFKPANQISLVEVLKIIYEATPDNKKIKQDQDWYKPYLKFYAKKNAIPDTVNNPFKILTRYEISEVLYRILTNNQDLKAVTYNDLTTAECTTTLPNIDLATVQQTWLDWSNNIRTELGLNLLSINPYLNQTATEWSNYSLTRGYIDHKRIGQTNYYDYGIIENWFNDFGITFKNINTITFTETIGWGYYSCSTNDCTSSVIKAIDSSFQFIMSEKNKTYRPHYNSLINPNFSQLGFGLALDKNTKKYFLTIHYGTQVEADTDKINESIENC